MRLTGRHRATSKAVFADPVRSNVVWSDVESMLVACGAEVEAGRGSRVRIALRGLRAVFHRPPAARETDKGALKSVGRPLTEAGIEP